MKYVLAILAVLMLAGSAFAGGQQNDPPAIAVSSAGGGLSQDGSLFIHETDTKLSVGSLTITNEQNYNLDILKGSVMVKYDKDGFFGTGTDIFGKANVFVLDKDVSKEYEFKLKDLKFESYSLCQGAEMSQDLGGGAKGFAAGAASAFSASGMNGAGAINVGAGTAIGTITVTNTSMAIGCPSCGKSDYRPR